jgi:hypothetical protein
MSGGARGSPSADSTLFVSLESNPRAPHALSPAAVAGIVAKHANRAELPARCTSCATPSARC